MSTPQERRLLSETRQLNNLRTELAKEQEKIRAALVEIERDRRILETEKREWKVKKTKSAMEIQRASSMPPQSPSFRSIPRTFSDLRHTDAEIKVQKLQLALDKLKKENTEKDGDVRALRRKIANLERDNRVLNKQLAGKNRGTPHTSTNDSYLTNLSRAQVKRLKIELKIAKKKILKLLSSVRVRKRYFGRQITRFKKEEASWRQERQRIFEKERVVIKHVFPDDILKIKLSRGKGTTLVTESGEVTINPEKVVMSRHDDENVQSEEEQLNSILGVFDLDDVEVDEDDEDEKDSDDSESEELHDDALLAELDDPNELSDEEMKELDAPVFPPLQATEEIPNHNGYYLGDDVVIHNGGDEHGGTVRYIGETEESNGDVMYGIELTDGSLGTGNGMVGESTYFECPDLRGIFVKEIRRKMRQKDREEFEERRIRRERNLTLRRTSSATRYEKRIVPKDTILAPLDFDQLVEVLHVSHQRAQQLAFDAVSEDFRTKATENNSRPDGIDFKFADLIVAIKEAMQTKALYVDMTLQELEARCADINRLHSLFSPGVPTSPSGQQSAVRQLVGRVRDRHQEQKTGEISTTELVKQNKKWRDHVAKWTSEESGSIESPVPASPRTPSSARLIPKKIGVKIPTLNPRDPKRWQRTPKNPGGD